MFAAVLKMKRPLSVKESGPYGIEVGRLNLVKDGVVVAPGVQGFESDLEE